MDPPTSGDAYDTFKAKAKAKAKAEAKTKAKASAKRGTSLAWIKTREAEAADSMLFVIKYSAPPDIILLTLYWTARRLTLAGKTKQCPTNHKPKEVCGAHVSPEHPCARRASLAADVKCAKMITIKYYLAPP